MTSSKLYGSVVQAGIRDSLAAYVWTTKVVLCSCVWHDVMGFKVSLVQFAARS